MYHNKKDKTEIQKELNSLKNYISSLIEERRNSSLEEQEKINSDLTIAYDRKYYLLKILNK